MKNATVQVKMKWFSPRFDRPIEFILEEVILTWLDLKMIFMILKMVLLSESFFLEWTNAGTSGLPMARNSTINCNNFGCDPSPFPQWVCYVTTPLTEW